MDFKKIIEKIENFGCEHPSYWGCALAGEVGEACNLIKKHERDGKDIAVKLAEELADVFIYTALTADYFKVDLQEAILKKLEKIRIKREEKR